MSESDETDEKSGIDLAIDKAGGQAALAELLSKEGVPITPQAVQQWQSKGFVPAPRRPEERNRILDVERISGVPRHRLNPWVYPDHAQSA